MIRRRIGRLALVSVGAAVALAAGACSSGTSSGDKTATARAGAPPVTTAVTRAITPPAAGTSVATGTATTSSPRASTTSGGAAGTTVAATEKDFAIGLDKTTVAAGAATFSITNNGPSTHEFIVFKTDIPADQLPQDTDNHIVKTDASGLTKINGAESVAPNTTSQLPVTLTPGKYVVICNITAHYEQGMHASFTVQ